VKVHNTFRHADIVVVADPASYEGQHAIYEAMGNGAIIVANKRWVRNAGVDVRI
jgi:Ni,Fe-hydrogenase III small subunit